MPSRYIMIGGFLGAGKTTLIQRFAAHINKCDQKVGLITNDQGAGLVDSAIGRSNRFPVEEISGGCFCCRFNSLIDAAVSLTEDTRPDVFLAEPVGSCTDLVATVETYLESDANVPATAKRMFTHRHTIRYRLERIRELSGHDATATEGRERLGLGIKAMRVLGIAAPRGPAREKEKSGAG